MQNNGLYPNIAYVLVADKQSPFLWWTIVSMLLVKELYRYSCIHLCTDFLTMDVLSSLNHPIMNVVDKIHSIEPFNGTLRERSRWLKTNMRLMVNGDFIYLDCDAIPINGFSEIFSHTDDISLVENIGGISDVASWYIPACRELNWLFFKNKYYNSGVFFLRDNYKSRLFSEMWRDKWLVWKKYDKSGVSADQPAFNSAIAESGLKVIESPSKFNVFLSHPLATPEDPRIFHFPASIRSMHYSSLLSRLARNYKKTRQIDLDLFRQAQKKSNPWVLPLPVVWLEYIASAAKQMITRRTRSFKSSKKRKTNVR